VKRYLIEFNTESETEVATLVASLLTDPNATSLKVQVFDESDPQSDETAMESRSKPKVAKRREDVFSMKQRGFSNQEIAKKLKIAPNTVGNDLAYWRREGYDI